jgi:hypothetical protein
MMRSASTWSFNACLEILKEAGRNPLGEHSASFQGSYLDKADPSRDFVFTSHQLDAFGIEMLSAGRAKAVCTHRDPLDAIVSGMSFLQLTFEEMLDELDQSVRTMVRIPTLSGSVLFIAYEDITDDSSAQIDRLTAFLGTTLTTTQIAEVDARTGLQKMKEIADNFEALDGQRVVPGPGPWAYDRETLLHPHHIQDAQTGKGYLQLTAAQRQLVCERLRGPFIEIGRVLPEPPTP